jgi:hypothetical protein
MRKIGSTFRKSLLWVSALCSLTLAQQSAQEFDYWNEVWDEHDTDTTHDWDYWDRSLQDHYSMSFTTTTRPAPLDTTISNPTTAPTTMPTFDTVQAVVDLEYTVLVSLQGVSVFDVPPNDDLEPFLKTISQPTEALLELYSPMTMIHIRSVGGLQVGTVVDSHLDNSANTNGRRRHLSRLRHHSQTATSRHTTPTMPHATKRSARMNQPQSRRIHRHLQAQTRPQRASYVVVEFQLTISRVACYRTDCLALALLRQSTYESVLTQSVTLGTWTSGIRVAAAVSILPSVNLLTRSTVVAESVEFVAARTVSYSDGNGSFPNADISVDVDEILNGLTSSSEDRAKEWSTMVLTITTAVFAVFG